VVKPAAAAAAKPAAAFVSANSPAAASAAAGAPSAVKPAEHARSDGNNLVAEWRDWYQKPDPNWAEKDGCEVVKWDPSLEPWKGALKHRYVYVETGKKKICRNWKEKKHVHF
jgi:hypothetical protein